MVVIAQGQSNWMIFLVLLHASYHYFSLLPTGSATLPFGRNRFSTLQTKVLNGYFYILAVIHFVLLNHPHQTSALSYHKAVTLSPHRSWILLHRWWKLLDGRDRFIGNYPPFQRSHRSNTPKKTSLSKGRWKYSPLLHARKMPLTRIHPMPRAARSAFSPRTTNSWGWVAACVPLRRHSTLILQHLCGWPGRDSMILIRAYAPPEASWSEPLAQIVLVHFMKNNGDECHNQWIKTPHRVIASPHPPC